MTTPIGVAGIAIGFLIVVQWGIALATGRVPELRTRPIEIRLHLLAEGITALVLIVGGAATVAGTVAGPALLLAGLGMLTYTAIVSPGYFWQRGERGPVAMFGVIILIAVACAAYLISHLALA